MPRSFCDNRATHRKPADVGAPAGLSGSVITEAKIRDTLLMPGFVNKYLTAKRLCCLHRNPGDGQVMHSSQAFQSRSMAGITINL